MMKRFALIGTFALMFAAFAAPARAEVHVGINVGIGAPVVARVPVRPVVVAPARVYAPPPPPPGYVWQPAHYVWTAYGYQWMPGAWVPAPYLAPAPYVARPVVLAPRPAVGVGIVMGRGHAYGHWK